VQSNKLWTLGIGINASAAFIARLGVTKLIVLDNKGDIYYVESTAIGTGIPVRYIHQNHLRAGKTEEIKYEWSSRK